MIRYIAAILMPFLIVLGGVVWTHGRFQAVWLRDWVALALQLIVIPLIAATVAVRLVHDRGPRRWLVRGVARSRKALTAGLFAGCLGVGIIGVGVSVVNRNNWYEMAWPTSLALSDSFYVFGSEHVSGETTPTGDWTDLFRDGDYLVPNDRPLMRSPIGPEGMMTGVATFVCVLLVTSLLPKRRPGTCVRCRYDIRFSLDSGICPECGTAISPGV